jgi:hypothetical protein
MKIAGETSVRQFLILSKNLQFGSNKQIRVVPVPVIKKN